jgi:hypothetical protein
MQLLVDLNKPEFEFIDISHFINNLSRPPDWRFGAACLTSAIWFLGYSTINKNEKCYKN